MGDTGQPPPGEGWTPQSNPFSTTTPDQRSATSAWAGGRVSGGNLNRNFAKILEDEKRQRNIIEYRVRVACARTFACESRRSGH